MANTKNPYGKPVFDDTYSFPQDSQDAVDFTDEFANVRRGTSATRQSLPVAKQRPGMLFTESDTGIIWRTDGAGAWRVVSSPDTGWISVTFENGWVNAATGEEVQYRRLNGVVYLRGRAALGSTGAVFTLPEGFRPKGFIRALPPSGVGTTNTPVTINPGSVVANSGAQPYFGAIAPFPADQ